MKLKSKHGFNAVIYLMPVMRGSEPPPENQTSMLCCDARGNLLTTTITNSSYELACNYATKLESASENYAILGLETAPGESLPLAVTITPEQVWALDNILEHAFKRGLIPDILKRYVKQVIKLGENKSRELELKRKRAEKASLLETTPKVLQRLDYADEGEVEVSVPIYKAKYRYPLIILKRLKDFSPETDQPRLLIMDSDGDLAIIKVSAPMIDEAEKNFEEWKRVFRSDGCIIFVWHAEGLVVNHLEISWAQRKALDLTMRRFEETGRGEKPVPIEAQEVLNRARARASATG